MPVLFIVHLNHTADNPCACDSVWNSIAVTADGWLLTTEVFCAYGQSRRKA